MEQFLTVRMTQERTKNWVRLLPRPVLTMSSQWSSPTGYTPYQLFYGGRPAGSFKGLSPEDYMSPVGDWLEHKQDLANVARSSPKHLGEHEVTTCNRFRHPASLKLGDLVLVHHY